MPYHIPFKNRLGQGYDVVGDNGEAAYRVYETLEGSKDHAPDRSSSDLYLIAALFVISLLLSAWLL